MGAPRHGRDRAAGTSGVDPGNWSDVDTVPDAAWGLWDFDSDVNTLAFASEASNVSFTLLRTAGGDDITVVVNAYLAGSPVGSTSVRLVGSSSATSLTLPWTLDEVEHYLTPGSGFAYAIDDLSYEMAGDCPP